MSVGMKKQTSQISGDEGERMSSQFPKVKTSNVIDRYN